MRIGRTLTPAAAPIGLLDIASGMAGLFRGREECDRFAATLKSHFGVKHCFLVSSGQAALCVSLLALKELFPGRDEVIVPAFTCFSVPASVLQSGLKIKLCDLGVETLDFNYTELAGSLNNDLPTGKKSMAGSVPAKDASRKILAILPTHLFGCPADIPRLREMISDPGITVIEDAAQAMGESSCNQFLGTLGDIGFFSLGRGKAFSTVEGGVIFTNRDDIAGVIAKQLENLHEYGAVRQIVLAAKALAIMVLVKPMFFWIPRSLPFLKLGETLFEPSFSMRRMSGFQAGLARRWQQRLDDFTNARRTNSRHWTDVIDRMGGDISHFASSTPGPAQGVIRFPIRVRDRARRNKIMEASDRAGAGIMPVYPKAISELHGPGIVPQSGFPVARSCASELLTLPTHEYVNDHDRTTIGEILRAACAAEGRQSR